MPINQPRLNQGKDGMYEKPENIEHNSSTTFSQEGLLEIARGLVLGAFFIFASQASAQTPSITPSATPSPLVDLSSPTPEADSASSELKKLSLEQLMDLDVTSVDKQPEHYGEAPAAIQVITNDEIRRSGASTIPEALRLADNLDVAQKDSHDWAISARGFNTDS